MNSSLLFLVDLESLDLQIEDEDKAIFLVLSLAPSYKKKKEIMRKFGYHLL